MLQLTHALIRHYFSMEQIVRTLQMYEYVLEQDAGLVFSPNSCSVPTPFVFIHFFQRHVSPENHWKIQLAHGCEYECDGLSL